MNRSALTLTILAALALPASAQAVVLPVTNTNDSGGGSLRAAVDAAAAGETVSIPPGTYRLISGQLNVTQGIRLLGLGGKAADVTIAAEAPGRVVCVSNSSGLAQVNRVRITGGVGANSGACNASASGGGIAKVGAGDLRIQETTVEGNRAATGVLGGGGIAVSGTGLTEVLQSAVIRNSATVSSGNTGGAGIAAEGDLNVRNTTIGENQLTAGAGVTGGGSGLFVRAGNTEVENVTLTRNSRNGGGSGAMRNNGGNMDVGNTAVVYNGETCSGAMNEVDPSAADDGACSFAFDNVHPNLGTLFDQGGFTPTYISVPVDAPADRIVDRGNCTEGTDQRGAPRPEVPNQGRDCDIGANEFDGLATAFVPDCTRTGEVPFDVISPPAGNVESFQYRVAGGPQQGVGVPGLPKKGSGTLTIPEEGRHPVEYWGDSTPTGLGVGEEFNHHNPVVVVDRTNPTVAVRNPNKYNVFVVRRSVKVNVSAADSISGLAQNPSGSAGISTASRGAKTYKPTAVDLCENAAAGAFNYRVLAPALGSRLVVEELKNGAKVRSSAKKFSSLGAPRELRVKSLVDSRKGRVRVTVSKDSKTGIQDSEFSGGVFQVRQSRKRSAKGLTELRLAGGSFSGCAGAVGARAGSVADDIVNAAARRVVRRLKGRGKGRFRTRGRYSAATVRGTTWTVEDRCDGTLTRVTSGRVSVRDFVRNRTVTIRAGRSYLARAG